ncbi:sterol desaturase [Capsaspora owczarzaki ATCC 30864]|uniref:Sterol desaturase n=1 Tax=Capsaspora owczarzaki (strain ATCC 30864) TaxID=595528 RepID=A0A0D2WRU5_CAPO3|nr:sterol desaturase [Capsaspora owczarzaki ATCC 30864]KJE94740.1 sterol desaturase [Capsaspora owczarzaki ATCC 30864]|eukprot:XP_004347017.2 sterol desaturase [Capsaspora owczarzaki ATCC 30864]
MIALVESSVDALAGVWQGSHDMWTSLWMRVSSSASDFNLWVWGTLISHLLVFWLLNAFYLTVDLTQKPKWMLKFKIQDGQNQPVDKARLYSAIKRALFNQLFMMPVFSAASFGLAQARGIEFGTPLPSFQTIIFHLACYGVVEEIMFYYSHRLLHWGVLYKRIHKLHHEWTAPIGITAIYAHPIEHLLSNLIPVAAGPLIMGSHLVVFWIWYSLAIFVTCTVHSGYHLPFMPSSEFHDFHHLKFTNNFGVLGFLDWLHGTDKTFRASVQFQRHFTSMSPRSLKEIVPDVKAKAADAKSN